MTSVSFKRELAQKRANIDEIVDDREYELAERVFQRFLHKTEQISIGEQGRLNIPADLADFAGLARGKPVLIVGNDTVIEIWSPDKYSEHLEPLEIEPEEADRLMRKISRRPGAGRRRAAVAAAAPGDAE
jgi:DNA-binding transcriptional regulator/RsmH inhibitor MraZ